MEDVKVDLYVLEENPDDVEISRISLNYEFYDMYSVYFGLYKMSQMMYFMQKKKKMTKIAVGVMKVTF